MIDKTLSISLPRVRDADAEALVAQVVATGQQPLSELGAAGARKYLEDKAAAGAAGPQLESVWDEVVHSEGQPLSLRIYQARRSATVPLVVYFHGGGWVVGSVNTADAFCRRLASAADCVIVSVEYPLAPEHPFPAAVDCATVALNWVVEQLGRLAGEQSPVAVLGDSAGGNLATVATRRLAPERRSVVKRQILAYPGTADDTADDSRDSGNQFANAWPLTDAERAWFLQQYVPDASQRSHPDVAPLRADVSGMPPTSLLLGGCDPIVAEGLAYANHLWASGVPTDVHLYGGQIHGFLTLDANLLPRSKEALGLVANIIRSL